MTNRDAGLMCEQKVSEYLIKKGMTILERNFYCREGEIDIVARDGEYIVFVEVKARKNMLFGSPCEAVTYKKQRKIIMAAQMYLQKSDTESALRFDVIEIIYSASKDDVEIKSLNHIISAFEE